MFASSPKARASACLTWGDQQLQAVDEYTYLGVQLHVECTWDAQQAARAAQKGHGAIYAANQILCNPRIHAAVRCIVLQAVVRPVVEYASTVWHPTAAQLAKLERSSIAGSGQHLSSNILRMEFGCRSYGSWMQHKLEYAFTL